MNKIEKQIYLDTEALSQAAASHFAAIARRCVADGRPFYTAISGGGTPRRTYRILAEEQYRKEGFWQAAHFFWCDERCVPTDDPQSNFGEANRLFLAKNGVPPEQLHRVRGELSQTAAVMDYSLQLQELATPGYNWPRFDLVLLGLGADGHTASLFPGSDPQNGESTPVLAATGAYAGRPAERITLTQAVFNTARQVIFLVCGANKAEAVVKTLSRPADLRRWPAQRIQPFEGQVVWMMDEAAGKLLEDRDEFRQ
jgi:6-phosphogluconolactonase